MGREPGERDRHFLEFSDVCERTRVLCSTMRRTEETRCVDEVSSGGERGSKSADDPYFADGFAAGFADTRTASCKISLSRFEFSALRCGWFADEQPREARPSGAVARMAAVSATRLARAGITDMISWCDEVLNSCPWQLSQQLS